MTLSDIQQELAGLSPRKLSKLAALSKNWDDDTASPSKPEIKDVPKSGSADAWLGFWEQNPETTPTQSQPQLQSVLRIAVVDGLSIELSTTSSNIDVEKLLRASNPLIKELRRQNVLPADNKNGGNND